MYLYRRWKGINASVEDKLQSWTSDSRRRAERFLTVLDSHEQQKVWKTLKMKTSAKDCAAMVKGFETARISPAKLISSFEQIKAKRFIQYFEELFDANFLTSTRQDKSAKELNKWLSDYWSKVQLGSTLPLLSYRPMLA
ncbi:hypothetical protein ABBQ38_010792 [Trebouxia sp. C0009 RCD-2024]